MLLQRQLESTKYQLSTSTPLALFFRSTRVCVEPCAFWTTLHACFRFIVFSFRPVTLQQKHDSAETVVRAQRNELEDLHRVILAEKKVSEQRTLFAFEIAPCLHFTSFKPCLTCANFTFISLPSPLSLPYAHIVAFVPCVCGGDDGFDSGYDSTVQSSRRGLSEGDRQAARRNRHVQS